MAAAKVVSSADFHGWNVEEVRGEDSFCAVRGCVVAPQKMTMQKAATMMPLVFTLLPPGPATALIFRGPVYSRAIWVPRAGWSSGKRIQRPKRLALPWERRLESVVLLMILRYRRDPRRKGYIRDAEALRMNYV